MKTQLQAHAIRNRSEHGILYLLVPKYWKR
jgi:hypothetical protein